MRTLLRNFLSKLDHLGDKITSALGVWGCLLHRNKNKVRTGKCLPELGPV